MISSWNDKEAKKCNSDLLALRVYTSQLLGKEEDLVLHGGGNTSVKINEKNIFGESEDILYVKGSGWDLATIKQQGFSPVKLSALHQLAKLDVLSDMEMVKYQRMALTNPAAPNPSVEAILHAIIPYKFVDHTHADAVVVITNTPGGEKRIQEVFGKRILLVPYVMPGFILAKEIYEMTKGMDWNTIDGMILLNHGVFTFHDDPKISYENMIKIVSTAEQYLKKKKANNIKGQKRKKIDHLKIADLRKQVSQITGKPVLCRLDDSSKSVAFSKLANVRSITSRGPLTPDHIIRTKRTPVILTSNFEKDLKVYSKEYSQYFNKYHSPDQTQLDSAPKWAVWKGCGTISFGTTVKSVKIIEDISRHTKKAIYQAEHLDKWKALPKTDLFEMEYWSLEQAKMKKSGSAKPMQGKIALVTGAASGIGKACVERLVKEGAVVAALDINPTIVKCFAANDILGIQCDVTNTKQIKKAIEKTVSYFGGLDMLVSNAGIFPESVTIAEMDRKLWDKSINLNLNSHLQLMQLTIPYLELGIDPAMLIIGSKNVLAPGIGVSAYSVAKAGLTQLARVAALELGSKNIRVNTIHPNAVFDTGIWTNEALKTRAKHYGLTVKEYKANNVLKVEITSLDIANLVVVMLGDSFSKTTGTQVPIDGGNERVI